MGESCRWPFRETRPEQRQFFRVAGSVFIAGLFVLAAKELAAMAGRVTGTMRLHVIWPKLRRWRRSFTGTAGTARGSCALITISASPLVPRPARKGKFSSNHICRQRLNLKWWGALLLRIWHEIWSWTYKESFQKLLINHFAGTLDGELVKLIPFVLISTTPFRPTYIVVVPGMDWAALIGFKSTVCTGKTSVLEIEPFKTKFTFPLKNLTVFPYKKFGYIMKKLNFFCSSSADLLRDFAEKYSS
jgi:hypothetical protein